MLVSLLPGVRELRAPLAAGYLWLVTLWIALAPKVPTMIASEGVYRDIYNLGQAVGKPAVAIASAFVAYLIGTLSVGLTSLLNLRLASSNRTREAVKTPIRQAVFGRIEELLKPESKSLEEFRRVLSSARDYLEAADARNSYAIDNMTISSPPSVDQYEFTYQSGENTTTVGFAYDAFQLEAKVLALKKDSDLAALMSNSAIRRQLATSIIDFDQYTNDCVEDLPSLAARLVGKEPEVYGAYDRLRAEAEFRLGVAVPLAVLFLTLAYRSSPFWALGTLLCMALAELGRRSSLQAFVQLAESLHAKRLDSPVLERIGTEPLKVRSVGDFTQEVRELCSHFIQSVSPPNRNRPEEDTVSRPASMKEDREAASSD